MHACKRTSGKSLLAQLRAAVCVCACVRVFVSPQLVDANRRLILSAELLKIGREAMRAMPLHTWARVHAHRMRMHAYACGARGGLSGALAAACVSANAEVGSANVRQPPEGGPPPRLA
jgi:hypothetical protein